MPPICRLPGGSGPRVNRQDPCIRAEGQQPLSCPPSAGLPAGEEALTENKLREDFLSFPRNVAELGPLQTPGGEVSTVDNLGPRASFSGNPR